MDEPTRPSIASRVTGAFVNVIVEKLFYFVRRRMSCSCVGYELIMLGETASVRMELAEQ